MRNPPSSLSRPTKAATRRLRTWPSMATAPPNRAGNLSLAMVRPKARPIMQRTPPDHAERKHDVHATPVKGLISLAVRLLPHLYPLHNAGRRRLSLPSGLRANPTSFQATNAPVKDVSSVDCKMRVMMESARKPNICTMRRMTH